MSKVIKFLLIIAGIIIFGLVCFAIAIFYSWYFEWPTWAGWLGLAVTIIVIVLFLLGIHLLRTWNERRYTDASLGKRKTSQEHSRNFWNQRNLLQVQWKQAIVDLKKSKISRRGNPLYVLPWFLVIGPQGAGKSLAVKNSKLSVPFTGDDQQGKQLELDGCRWWFLEESIVLDLPGNYISQQNSMDRAAWRQFLSLLKKYRHAQPLNGVVLTIPVTDLIDKTDDKIRELAVLLRERLEDCIQRLGINFPVYIQISKCDQIEGMSRFFQAFPPDALHHAMGMLNEQYSDSTYTPRFIEKTIARIYRQLNKLRVTALNSGDMVQTDAKTIIFPEEFHEIRGPLLVFATTLMDKEAYTETPMLRGVYFSSAHQEGTPHSVILPKIGFHEENISQNPGNRSFFLRDFFGKVLRRDKNLVYPTRHSIGLQNLTQNLGAVAWLVFCLFAGIVFTVAFTKNLSVLGNASAKIPEMTNIATNFDEELQNLDKFRSALINLKKENVGWWVPRIGFNQSIAVEQHLAKIYTKKFRNYVLVPVDRDISKFIKQLDGRSAPLTTAQYIDLLSRRIKLSKLFQENRLQKDAAIAKNLPNFRFMLGQKVTDQKSILPEMMRDNYLTYIQWEADNAYLIDEAKLQEVNLQLILSHEDIGLNWLTNWANFQENLKDVKGDEFWGGETRLKDGQKLMVDRAYTPEGWGAINDFIKNIESVRVSESFIQRARMDFEEKYRTAYFRQWQSFLENFHTGEKLWQGDEKRLELAVKMTLEDSAYRKLLKKANEHLDTAVELAKDSAHVPDWVWLVERFQLLQDPNYLKILKSADGLLNTLVNKAGKVFSRARAELRKGDNQESMIQKDKKALVHVESYFKSLEQVAETTSAAAALQMSKEVFKEAQLNVGEPKQVAAKMYWDIKQLRKILAKGTAQEEVFWSLLMQQSNLVWAILVDQSEKQLQTLWDSEVLADAASLEAVERIKKLQGENGVIWEFRDKQVMPFIKKASAEYKSVVLFDEAIDFNPDFLRVLVAGKVGEQSVSGKFAVKITTIPTDTNKGANIKPHKTILSIQCASGNQEVINQQFLFEKSVEWSPQDCGDVILEIHVGELILKKKYTGGYSAFIQFLNHFRTGKVIFYKNEFPEQMGQLTGYNIAYIEVKYNFRGHEQVLATKVAKPLNIPERIVLKRS